MRDYLEQEIERLAKLLSTIEDPTSQEYAQIKMLLCGTGGKGGTKGMIDQLIEIDVAAHKINMDDEDREIEKMKIMADLTKSCEQSKAEVAKSANEAKKLDIEQQRMDNEKEANDRKNAIEEKRVENEAREIEQREHMTEREAKSRRRELRMKGAILGAAILLTAGAQQNGLLDKTMVQLWPKAL